MQARVPPVAPAPPRRREGGGGAGGGPPGRSPICTPWRARARWSAPPIRTASTASCARRRKGWRAPAERIIGPPASRRHAGRRPAVPVESERDVVAALQRQQFAGLVGG